MSDGLALHPGAGGGRSRCAQKWQAFLHCMQREPDSLQCSLPREDYMECLHGRKAAERQRVLADQLSNIKKHGLQGVREGKHLVKEHE